MEFNPTIKQGQPKSQEESAGMEDVLQILGRLIDSEHHIVVNSVHHRQSGQLSRQGLEKYLAMMSSPESDEMPSRLLWVTTI